MPWMTTSSTWRAASLCFATTACLLLLAACVWTGQTRADESSEWKLSQYVEVARSCLREVAGSSERVPSVETISGCGRTELLGRFGEDPPISFRPASDGTWIVDASLGGEQPAVGGFTYASTWLQTGVQQARSELLVCWTATWDVNRNAEVAMSEVDCPPEVIAGLPSADIVDLPMSADRKDSQQDFVE